MRLFISIQLNDEMRDALSGLQGDLQFCGVRGNYTRDENMHLTLAFIGEYPDAQPVLDALETVKFRPFALQLEGAGSFGDLWWAGLKGSEPLKNLVRQVRHALADAEIPFDKKRFVPHITILRKARFDGAEPQCLFVHPTQMTVDHISLMRSDRGRHGMIYTELGRVQGNTRKDNE